MDTSAFNQLNLTLKNLATGIDSNVLQGLTIAGITVQDAARNIVPIDTGELRKSIQSVVSQMTGGATATITANEPYAADVEYGTPPGRYVSLQALMGWAMRHGVNPYAVSKSIFKKGTRAQPYLIPAFNANTDTIVAIIGQAIKNALSEVSS